MFILAFAVCFVLLKRNKLVIPYFLLFSKRMPSLAENVGKIISTHPHGPKMKEAPRAFNRINAVMIYFIENNKQEEKSPKRKWRVCVCLGGGGGGMPVSLTEKIHLSI